jgi:hypothetical protein
MPRLSSRGGTPPFATTPPRSPLVMPAFVPGWVSFSCRCHCRPHHARVVLCPASRFFGPPCRALSLWSAVVAEPPACAPLRACEILRAIAQPCTPDTRAPTWEAKDQPLAPFSHAETPRCVVSPSCADAWPKAVLFLTLASLGYDRTWLRCGSSHRRRTSPPASCGQAALPLGQTIEYLRIAPKPSGFFPSHVGPHAGVAAADRSDPVHRANPVLWRTLARAAPRCKGSSRDPVRPAQWAATQAIASV